MVYFMCNICLSFKALTAYCLSPLIRSTNKPFPVHLYNQQGMHARVHMLDTALHVHHFYLLDCYKTQLAGHEYKGLHSY